MSTDDNAAARLSERPDVVAAGAVVVRKKANGRGHEVLLVHRPRYDDWSFPKGKRDRGEHVAVCAVREVEEESGLRIVLGRPLSSQRYPLESKRMKTVHYWTARVRGAEDDHPFVPNDEVDELRWLGWEEADALLTYAHDRSTLAEARERRHNTRAVVVLRHADAMRRADWRALAPEGRDRDRPLTEGGGEQADRLRALLDVWAPEHLHSSPARRCLDTVAPYAAAAHLPVLPVEELSEEFGEGRSEEASEAAVGAYLASLPAKARVLLCSHRPVLPSLLESLHLTADQTPRRTLGTADVLVVHLRSGVPVATETHTLG